MLAKVAIRSGVVMDFELRKPLDQLFPPKAGAAKDTSDLVAVLSEPSVAASFEGGGEHTAVT